MDINDTMHAQAKTQLLSIVERVEALETQRSELADDVKDVFLEAKGNGFDVKIIRKIIAIRKKADHERMEEEALLATYMSALGMLSDLPLGQAAISRIGYNSKAAA